MFRVILALVHSLLMTAVYGTATKPDWRATSWTYPKNVTQRFIEIAGGEDALQEQISSILDRASYHKNGQPCTLHKTIEGRHTLVLRICFLNHECWAAKVWENTYYFPESAAAAVNSLKAIEKYCPDQVPHPTLHGDLFNSKNSTFLYHLTDWVDDVVDSQDFGYWSDDTWRYNQTFLAGVTRKLAQFFYNLTTCPIPDDERKIRTPSFVELTMEFGPWRSTSTTSTALLNTPSTRTKQYL
jgi:hypothetical protein